MADCCEAGASGRLAAISAMLGRAPETLNWKEMEITTLEYLLGYDLTEGIIAQHLIDAPESKIHEIRIFSQNGKIQIDFADQHIQWLLPVVFPTSLNSLFAQLALKMVLNMHSTMVAGILGWYEGNMMCFVRPSNQKLINRGIALTERMLSHRYRGGYYAR